MAHGRRAQHPALSDGACRAIHGDADERAPEEGKMMKGSGTGLHLVAVVRRVGPIAILAALMQIFMHLEMSIYVPYLYSRVHCCGGGGSLPAKYDIRAQDLVGRLQEAALTSGLKLRVQEDGSIGACDVPQLPPSSAVWSFSPTCPNKAYVQESVQHLIAGIKPLQKLFAFLVLPVGGSLADRVGRLPVLAVYVAGIFVASLVSLWDAYIGGTWGNGPVYVAGCLLGLTIQPKESILTSAVCDVMGHDEADKGRAFVYLKALNEVVTLGCEVLAYLYLCRHNQSYMWAWAGFSAFSLFVFAVITLLVPETLPPNFRGPPTTAVFNPLKAQLASVRLICRDRILVYQTCIVCVFFIYFSSFITLRTSYLTAVGFRVEEAMLPQILATGTALLFGVGLFPLIPKIGMWHMSTLGNSLFAVGYAFMGLFTVLVSGSGPYVASACFACGGLVTTTSFHTIVSQRVEPENQGKLQGAVFSIGTLGAVVGIPLYNKVLFDATAEGFAKALCPTVSMCLAAACAGMSVVVTGLARTSPPPGDPREVELANQ